MAAGSRLLPVVGVPVVGVPVRATAGGVPMPIKTVCAAAVDEVSRFSGYWSSRKPTCVHAEEQTCKCHEGAFARVRTACAARRRERACETCVRNDRQDVPSVFFVFRGGMLKCSRVCRCDVDAVRAYDVCRPKGKEVIATYILVDVDMCSCPVNLKHAQ